MTENRVGVQAEIDRAAFAAAAARMRDKDGFHVVRMQSLAEELDQHHLESGATSRVPAVATQKCTSCASEKPLTAFYFVGRSGKRQSICGECLQARAAAGREAAIANGRRRRTVVAEIQEMLEPKAPTSEGVTGDAVLNPIRPQAPAVSTASDPNAGSDAEEQPVASSDVDLTDARLEYLEDRLAEWEQVYLTSQQARVEYFHLLMKVAEWRWKYNHEFDPIANRIEKMLDHMRYSEDEWPK